MSPIYAEVAKRKFPPADPNKLHRSRPHFTYNIILWGTLKNQLYFIFILHSFGAFFKKLNCIINTCE